MDDQTTPPGTRDMVSFTIGFEAAIVLVAFLLGWLLDVSPLERIAGAADPAKDLRAIGIGAVAILPMLLMLVTIRALPIPVFRQLNEVVDQTLVPIFRHASLTGLAIISIAAGIGEELLFRGVLHAKFQLWWNTTSAIVVSSMLFGICHWVTASYAALATVIGVYMAILLERYDNLLVPITAHALYDLAALVYLVRLVPAAGDSPPGAE